MGKAERQRLTEITNTLHHQHNKLEPVEQCIILSDDELHSIDVIDIPITDGIFDEYQITSKILEEY